MRTFLPHALLVAPLLVLAACEASPANEAKDRAESSDNTLAFWPPEAGRGTTVNARITAGASIFDFGDEGLSLGAGVTVESFTVLDGWTASAVLTVAGDAELGPRNAELDVSGGDFIIDDALTLVDDSFVISPTRAKIGESIQVEFVGQNTEWVSATTWAGFGEGIEVTAVDVLSESFLVADVTVSPDAIPGARDVFVENGPDLVTQYGAFSVDRVGLSASFTPAEVTQGQTTSFTIVGRDTHFSDESEIRFFQYGDEKEDIVIDNLTVIDAENLYGTMTVSNAAELGTRDVLVETDGEGVFIEDATNVVDAAIDIGQLGISRWFYVLRGIDNTTGDITEYVRAGAVFYLPLDPPCPPDPELYCTNWADDDNDGYTDCYDSDCSSDPACGGGPQPYDANGVFETFSSGGTADCPSNETVDVGDHVWFESACNIVTLDRYVDGSDGAIYYTADVTLDDYCFDQLYDLHIEGNEDLGIPEEIVVGAQPTVPADYSLLTPAWWGNFTHNRAEDLTYTWTPAQTYPDAYWVTSISGQLVDPNGASGYVGSLPWDDGEHTYTSAELSELVASPCTFTAYSYIKGGAVGFTFSSVTTESESYVLTTGTVVLE